MTDTPAEAPLNVRELKLLAQREQRTQRKRDQRRRKAEEHAEQAMRPSPTGYRVGAVPAGPSAMRRWIRDQHNAYSRRDLAVPELDQCRHTFRVLMDSYKATAELRRAEAALRAAEAQEKMADILASVEHGSVAVALLQRLREMPDDGARRPLPTWRQPAMPAPHEGGGT
jgi:hypothetical protein